MRFAAYGTVGVVTAGTVQAVYLRKTYITPDEPEGHRHGVAGKHFNGKPLRLLFVGDSICTGVGANAAAPLQAACAERLAALRGVPVVWRTIAKTGADVRELTALFSHRSSKAIIERGSWGVAGHHEDGHFDIAVVMCGVNDGKKVFQGRWPSVFRRDLEDLYGLLRKASPRGHIHIPQIPGYASAPLLNRWPLCTFVPYFFGPYEAQKEELAQETTMTSLSPPLTSMPGPEDATLWSHDGIHPSGEGYKMVGEWLGEALAGA